MSLRVGVFKRFYQIFLTLIFDNSPTLMPYYSKFSHYKADPE